jgi:serine protease Do
MTKERRTMSSKSRDLLKLTGIIAVTFFLGLTLASAFNVPRPGIAEPRSFTGTSLRGPSGSHRANGPIESFADVVDRVNPSVVYIQVGQHQRMGRHPDVPQEFQDFFRRFQQQPDQYRQGSGTGFIVSRDGYILTNNHVVADAEQIKVKLLDNREFAARLVGRDPNTDVAVIKIDASGLPAVTFGNSDQARVGDWVLAFGNPLGFTFTVTAGIVSAKGRQLDLPREDGVRLQIQDFIQTDAAINPGNSGGPLVNTSGEVVGINAAIASQTGLYAGYGFAIPSNLVHHVMDDLIAKGHVDRAILGINIRDANADDAAAVGLSDVKGVFVLQFPSDSPSPARIAGIQLGDVIVAVNDSAVDHTSQLQQMVGFRQSGESVRITVVRRENGHAGVRRSFDVRLVSGAIVEQTASNTDSTGGRSAVPSEMEGRLGVRIQALNATDAQQARLTDDQRGVIVTDVEEGGPSFQRLFPPNPNGGTDVILSVNDVRVRTPEDFKRALRAAAPGSVIQLRVLNIGAQGGATIRAVNVRSR